jgi:hypothetical protein
MIERIEGRTRRDGQRETAVDALVDDVDGDLVRPRIPEECDLEAVVRAMFCMGFLSSRSAGRAP